MITTKEKVYLRDKVATKVLSAPECREYLLKIISAALDIDYDYLINHYEAEDIRIGANTNIVNSEADIIGKTDKCYISLEINYNHGSRLDNKNMTYICQLILRQLDRSDKKKKKDYKEILPINQICLNNYDCFGKKQFIYRSTVMEEKYHLRRSNLINIIDINVDFLSNIEYNEIIKEDDDSLEKLLYIFVCNDKNLLDEIYLDNKIMDSVRKKLINLGKDLDEYLYYDKDEIMRLDAYDMVIEQTKKDAAMEMLKLDLPMDTISQVTKLSTEEIKVLQEELNNKED